MRDLRLVYPEGGEIRAALHAYRRAAQSEGFWSGCMLDCDQCGVVRRDARDEGVSSLDRRISVGCAFCSHYLAHALLDVQRSIGRLALILGDGAPCDYSGLPAHATAGHAMHKTATLTAINDESVDIAADGTGTLRYADTLTISVDGEEIDTVVVESTDDEAPYLRALAQAGHADAVLTAADA